MFRFVYILLITIFDFLDSEEGSAMECPRTRETAYGRCYFTLTKIVYFMRMIRGSKLVNLLSSAVNCYILNDLRS